MASEGSGGSRGELLSSKRPGRARAGVDVRLNTGLGSWGVKWDLSSALPLTVGRGSRVDF